MKDNWINRKFTLKKEKKAVTRASEFHTPEVMEKDLEDYPRFQKKLYCRGFLLTDKTDMNFENYPFYNNWSFITLGKYILATHKDSYSYYYIDKDGRIFFLVGHAYNPYTMQEKEEDILEYLSSAYVLSEEKYWDAESELTGVFCTGIILGNGNLLLSTDCCGMQLVYHGIVKGHTYITSHSKLVADLENLQRDDYITKLVNDKYFHYWGTWLPGDCSPFKELRRMQPNCTVYYRKEGVNIKRYYPKYKIKEVKTEAEYQEIIYELGRIMNNNMELIARKWPGETAISVTGGRDSMTTLACSNGLYDQFKYFSYISNYDESVDAYAAEKICNHLGIEHTIYRIPEDGNEVYDGIEVFKKVMECNAGCIGVNNYNDLKKRMYFSENPPCSMEVKSWVNEMGRGWYWNKYNKKKFPKYPSASYWRAMHKLYLSPGIIRETDNVFAWYLKKYYSKETFDKLNWLELYFWEFAWGGGEGVFLTSEHRVSYDITIPFNNRKYVEQMLKVPLEKRKTDRIPDDLIKYMNSHITETGITVHDVSHTNLRALLVRIYLELFSKVRFNRKKMFI